MRLVVEFGYLLRLQPPVVVFPGDHPGFFDVVRPLAGSSLDCIEEEEGTVYTTRLKWVSCGINGAPPRLETARCYDPANFARTSY
jgi:hypothetical protein